MDQSIIKTLNLLAAFLLGAIAFALIVGGPLWLLWNWLMPQIFGLPVITFWQAVGLNLLATILFKTNSHKPS